MTTQIRLYQSIPVKFVVNFLFKNIENSKDDFVLFFQDHRLKNFNQISPSTRVGTFSKKIQDTFLVKKKKKPMRSNASKPCIEKSNYKNTSRISNPKEYGDK